MKCVLSILSICFFILSTFSQEYEWEKTNGPYGGQVWESIILENGKIICGVSYGGMYFSEDKGLSWTKIENGLIDPDESYYSFAIDTLGNVFASSRYHAIYKSTDNGNSWQQSSTGLPNNFFWQIECTKKNLLLTRLYSGQIFSSTNSGESWELLNEELNDYYVNDMSISPKDNIYLATDSHGVLRSNDSGFSWEELNYGLPQDLSMARISALINDVIIIQHDYYRNYSPYISINGGVTWVPITIVDSTNYMLSATLLDNGTLVAGTKNGVYYSTDFGSTWNTSNFSDNGVDIYDIIQHEDYLLASCWGPGTIFSFDNGMTWEPMNEGFSELRILSLINFRDSLLVAATDNGVYTTADKGENWENYWHGLGDFYVTGVTTNSKGDIYASTWYSGVHKLNKGDSVFTNISNKDIINLSPRFIECGLNDEIYTGGYFGYGLYVTDDDGNNWKNLGEGILERVQSLEYITDSILFVGLFTNGHPMYYTTDKGNSWNSHLFSNSEQRPVKGFRRIKKTQDGKIFALAEYVSYGLFMSNDTGKTWEDRTNIHGIGAERDLHITNDNMLCIGGESGWVTSTDFGKTWVHHDDRIRSEDISAITSFSDGTLFTGVLHGTVYKGAKITSNGKTVVIKNDFYLLQNYPNPFNPSTKIKFNIPDIKSNHGSLLNTKLVVYDVLGRKVKTLINDLLQPGVHEVVFDGSDLPSGIYFYKLITDKFTQTNKMLLIR